MDTYFTHFEVIIAKKIDTENCYFAHFQVLIVEKIDIENHYHRAN